MLSPRPSTRIECAGRLIASGMWLTGSTQKKLKQLDIASPQASRLRRDAAVLQPVVPAL